MNIFHLRKLHRILGLFIGIQFLFWTGSGLYFSWTNLDEIHGDQFKNKELHTSSFSNLFDLSEIEISEGINSLELIDINSNPFYWINGAILADAKTGILRDGITHDEAIGIAEKRLNSNLKIKSVELITESGNHHEYRGRELPAYVLSFVGTEKIKAYISQKNGKFQTVRHRQWRIFDFLWMTHTMDYKGRDNFNTLLLRTFSLLGLITVLSGFALWGGTVISRNRMKSRGTKT